MPLKSHPALRRPGAAAAVARITGAIAVAATLIAILTVASAQAATGPYVALGDSYTAGPLVPHITGQPVLCLRSTNNYPSDVTRAIDPSSFTDAACSGATTADMTQPQSLAGGRIWAPPQFDALRADDALVTVGIGGNDADLIGVAEKCVEIDLFHPFKPACKEYYDSGGVDPNVAAVAATGPKVASVLQGIHERAPDARVLLVGYPDGLPVDGTACWPLVPASPGDVLYVDSLEEQLNAVLAEVAGANDATYVDTFTSSIGHDACKPAGTAWVNGIIPTSAAAPLHPNEAGEQNMANQVLSDL
ncbi:MAG: SGNH/GDSL hydrolase family protein [Solirubrobacteraceae bacterium]